MRVFRIFIFLGLVAPGLISLSAFAADLTIRVVDPNSAAVVGVQVSIFSQQSTTPLGVLTTSTEGKVVMSGWQAGSYRVQVLAPGFSPANVDVSLPQDSTISVTLAVAKLSQTVVVTATRTPLPLQDAASSVSTLKVQP